MVETTTQTYITKESPEIEAYKLGLLKAGKELTDKPVNIPLSKVANMSPEQLEAIKMAKSGIGSYQPFLNTAQENYTAAGGAEGFGGLADIGKAAVNYGIAGASGYDPNMTKQFMNPYQAQVTQEAMKEMQRNADLQKANLNSQAVKSGAFGGSRQGVQQTELGRNLYDIQSKRLFEDYANNYNQALGASMTSFENQQKRAQNVGNLALGAGQLQATGASGIAALGKSEAELGQLTSGLQQGDTSFLYNIGQKEYDYQQKVLDTDTKNALTSAYEPYQRLSYLSDIYKGAPSSQSTLSSTSAPSPSLTSQLIGGGVTALSAYNLFNKPT
jgi:hypothetical protein